MQEETSDPPEPSSDDGADETPGAQTEAEEAGGDAVAADTDVVLPTGDALSYADASSVMKAVPARVVLVAGENDAGKTSLLCSIYERFLRGEFAGHRFCGSQTLVAYEQRCFLQRPESGLSEPDTERTRLPAGELALLHLELEGASSGERQALLATDLAGEAFRLIRDNPDECENYAVLSRIDCLTVLLDGRRLRLAQERHGHVNATRTMLRSMLQSEQLPEDVPIVVAISKWDLLDTDAARRSAVSDAEELLGVVRSNPTEILRIAPAPQRPSSLQPAHGVTKLLRTWVRSESEELELDIDADDGETPIREPFDTFGPTTPGS